MRLSHSFNLSTFFTLTTLFVQTLAKSSQVPLLSGSCDVSNATISDNAISRLGLTSNMQAFKSLALGIGTITYSCSAGLWVPTAEDTQLWDMSCLYTSSPSAFDTLPLKALPIYTRYKTSSGAIRSKLTTLVGFVPLNTGSVKRSVNRTSLDFDLSRGYGAAAKLTGPATAAASYTPNSNARTWSRYTLKRNSFATGIYLLQTSAGAPPSGSCSDGASKLIDFAGQYWIASAPPIQDQINSIISSKALKTFCSDLNRETVSSRIITPSRTLTSYTSTITVFAPSHADMVTKTLTSYTAFKSPVVALPSVLKSYPSSLIATGCSSYVPTPSRYTSYSTVSSGVATILSNRTVTATDGSLPMQTVYETVYAPKASAAILLAGDSSLEDRTPVNGGRSTGWGSLLTAFPLLTAQASFNYGSSGATTQSYLDGHRNQWPNLLANLRDNDIVILEFGINDSHQDLAGNSTIYSGPMETMVNTLRRNADNLTIILSSPIPLPTINGSWVGGIFYNKYLSRSRDYDWAALVKQTARHLGVLYVDHANAIHEAYQNLGEDFVTALYMDGLHTNSTGAYIVAQAFVRALKCSNARSALQLSIEAQKVGVYCSQYGEDDSSKDSSQPLRLYSDLSFLSHQDGPSQPDPFCFKLDKCGYDDGMERCFPLCR